MALGLVGIAEAHHVVDRDDEGHRSDRATRPGR
jgi:hypothetical protein